MTNMEFLKIVQNPNVGVDVVTLAYFQLTVLADPALAAIVKGASQKDIDFLNQNLSVDITPITAALNNSRGDVGNNLSPMIAMIEAKAAADPKYDACIRAFNQYTAILEELVVAYVPQAEPKIAIAKEKADRVRKYFASN